MNSTSTVAYASSPIACIQTPYYHSSRLLTWLKGGNFNLFLGGVGSFALRKWDYNQGVGHSVFSVTFLFMTAVGQIVLGPEIFGAKLPCTAVFALRNDKFSRLRGVNE